MIVRLSITLGIIISLALYLWWCPVTPPQPAVDVRWQKLDALGQPIALWAGPWHCVADRHTGLIWEAKTDDESIHDGYWTYSWFDGATGSPQQGDCFFSAQRCDTQLLITRVNQAQLCGFSDWRLPTRTELRSLLVTDAKPGAPTLDNAFFLHTKRSDYWTADAQRPITGFYRYLGKGAWAVNFMDASDVVLPYRNAAYVRLVRSESQGLENRDTNRLQKLNSTPSNQLVPLTQTRR